MGSNKQSENHPNVGRPEPTMGESALPPHQPKSRVLGYIYIYLSLYIERYLNDIS